MAYYINTGDKNVLDRMTTHYLAMDPEFGTPARGRDADTIEGMCWLYGQTGDARILAKAQANLRKFR